jgi:hypothetical protein
LRLLVMLGVAALVLPAGVAAKPGKHKAHGHRHRAIYVFKGTYSGNDAVHVRTGNRRVSRAGFVGEDVRFDFGTARFAVADTNGDGESDLFDVEVGDRVVVKVRMPRRAEGDDELVARRLVDRTNPEDAADDQDEADESPTAGDDDQGGADEPETLEDDPAEADDGFEPDPGHEAESPGQEEPTE